ncbi:hypothetical protein AB1K32_15285 [Metabacillus dongyingensis]|uniref:hypothetical protein n=1 Tax=Metabacillus dongyingensis TaxID=2874282 RepID=UPI003B8BF4D3
MDAALKDIIKARNHYQREINEAYEKIERYKEQIQVLMDCIQKKELLVNSYDSIIEHSRLLLPKDITASIPQTEEEMNHENK